MSEALPLESALRLFRAATGLEPQVRDMGALESSLSRPYAEFEGVPFYPSVHDQAAAIMESVNRNHPLLDGNKRLAWILVRVVYRSHDMAPLRLPPPAEVDAFVRAVASGRVPFGEIVGWLRQVFDPDGE